MQFSLDDLRLFLAIARQSSLAGASRQLGVNHSTVFRRLKNLEAALDARLFDRLPDGYVLTAAGEALRARAERVEDEAQAIERELVGRDLRLRGQIRLTTTDTLAGSFLAPLLKAFTATYPGIELELLVTGAFLDLGRREADIAIRPTASPPEDLIGRRLGSIRWGVYGARDYLQTANADGLAEHRFIGGNDLIAHLASNRWLEQNVPTEACVIRTNSILAALSAARIGMGLAVLPHYMARQHAELECVLAIGPEVVTDLWLLVHPDLRHNARVRAFMDFIVTAMEGYQAELEGSA